SAARTTARLMVRHARARTRIVGLLRFPSNDAALDVDLPTASTRAIHAMRGAYDLVVLPALPVALLPRAVFIAQLTEPLGERLAPPRQICETFEKMAHGLVPVLVEATTATEESTSRQSMLARPSPAGVAPQSCSLRSTIPKRFRRET